MLGVFVVYVLGVLFGCVVCLCFGCGGVGMCLMCLVWCWWSWYVFDVFGGVGNVFDVFGVVLLGGVVCVGVLRFWCVFSQIKLLTLNQVLDMWNETLILKSIRQFSIKWDTISFFGNYIITSHLMQHCLAIGCANMFVLNHLVCVVFVLCLCCVCIVFVLCLHCVVFVLCCGCVVFVLRFVLCCVCIMFVLCLCCVVFVLCFDIL